jgi:hypothetical protein
MRRVSRFPWMRPLAVAVAAAPLVACFVGYDSSWGSAKGAQKRAMASAGPATIETGSAKPGSATRVLRARIVASAAYVSQTLDWKAHVRALVDDVNLVLPGMVDARVEIASIESWDGAPKDEDAFAALEALARADGGDGVEEVVGMIGGLPRFSQNFHELGLGEVLGKRMVVRGTTSIDDQALIDARFDKLDEDARSSLRREYRRHRETAIFLHELAHNLGGLHEEASGSLLSPSYSRKAASFAPETLPALRLAVGFRVAEKPDRRAFAEELLAYYERTPATPWDARERASMMENLRVAAGRPPLGASGAPSTSASARKPVGYETADPALSEGDRALWDRAVAARAAGKRDEAWTIATPLFGKHLGVKSVQDFRCKLAVELRFDVARARQECAPLMELETGRR